MAGTCQCDGDWRRDGVVGSPEAFAEKLDAYRRVGVQRVYSRPLADETSQIHAFMDTVVPIVGRKEAPKRT